MNYLAFLLLLPTAALAINTTATPSLARQVIGREKVAALSKDYLIKSGLDDKDLEKWDSTIQTFRDAITLEPQEKPAVGLFNELNTANTFVKKTVKKLNSAYSPLYEKEKDKYVPRFKGATQSDVDEITALNSQAKKLKDKVVAVMRMAFPRTYVDAQPTPDSWVNVYIKNKKGALKSAEELFPLYTEFLKDLTASTSYEVFKTKYAAKYGLILNNEKSFTSLINQIEYCYYRVGQEILSLTEKKKSKKITALEEDRKVLKKISTDIRREFPDMYSNLDFYKIPKSTSMQRTVLSAYAEAMEGILKQIIRETDILLAAAKAAAQTAAVQPVTTPVVPNEELLTKQAKERAEAEVQAQQQAAQQLREVVKPANQDVSVAQLLEQGAIPVQLSQKLLLDLSDKNINDLTGLQTIPYINRVFTLDLTNNKLTTLPVGIFNGFTNLRKLHLTLNQLTTLPVGIFDGLNELKVLAVGDNPALPEAKVRHGYYDGQTLQALLAKLRAQ